MNGMVYSVDGKCPTLTTNKGEGIKIAKHTILPDGSLQWFWRRMLPIEAARAQGIPVHYHFPIKSSPTFEVVGNGWQVDTIEYILNVIFVNGHLLG